MHLLMVWWEHELKVFENTGFKVNKTTAHHPILNRSSVSVVPASDYSSKKTYLHAKEHPLDHSSQSVWESVLCFCDVHQGV